LYVYIMPVYLCYLCAYIYTCITQRDRDRDRERDRETGTEIETKTQTNNIREASNT
jgi:hypothetical protein